MTRLAKLLRRAFSSPLRTGPGEMRARREVCEVSSPKARDKWNKRAFNPRCCELIALIALATPAAAQEAKQPTPYQSSMAAGYKALMLCGAIFNGGRTEQQADKLELTGIYPEYEPFIDTAGTVGIFNYLPKPKSEPPPPGTPGHDAYLQQNPPYAGEVTVTPRGGGLKRAASWTYAKGCTILPPGVDAPLAGRGPDPKSNWHFPGSMDALPWPMGERGIKVTPAPALDAAIARAFDPATTGRTTGVVVLKDGEIVGEHYADGFGPHIGQRTWSAGKSIAGSLIGIAVRDHLLDVNQPAMPEKAGLRGRITIDQMLRMASGLHSEAAGNRTDAIYFGGTTVDEEAAYWQTEIGAGKRFRYSNLDILLAVRALRAAIHDDARYDAFPRKELFAKLGMTRTIAEQDIGGNFILSSQVWSTARDFARLGQFWLQDGVWQGERILPEGWMKYMTTPSGPQPPKGTGYGASIWLLGAKEGLPEGSYAAEGNRGQFIVVIPSRNIVIVRRGEDAAGAPFDMNKFSAAVLEALQ